MQWMYQEIFNSYQTIKDNLKPKYDTTGHPQEWIKSNRQSTWQECEDTRTLKPLIEELRP